MSYRGCWHMKTAVSFPLLLCSVLQLLPGQTQHFYTSVDPSENPLLQIPDPATPVGMFPFGRADEFCCCSSMPLLGGATALVCCSPLLQLAHASALPCCSLRMRLLSLAAACACVCSRIRCSPVPHLRVLQLALADALPCLSLRVLLPITLHKPRSGSYKIRLRTANAAKCLCCRCLRVLWLVRAAACEHANNPPQTS